MNKSGAPEDYYSFLDDQREVKFYRVDMPTPWMNYLSNGKFHVMISQAGGGVAFYRSPQIWRINHYNFFHIPTDRSGFYTYIKDGQDIWCPTNQPVATKPDEWSATHGMGYTRFSAVRQGVSVTAEYYVGEANALIWDLKITSEVDKTLTIYPFVELGMMEFLREMQWQCYNKHQLKVSYDATDQILVYDYAVDSQPQPSQTPLIYFAANVPIASFDGDRDEFIGSYRSEEAPIGIQGEHLSNSELRGGDPCFALQVNVDLVAGQAKHVRFFLGSEMTSTAIATAVSQLRKDNVIQEQRKQLTNDWTKYLSKFQCAGADPDIERMINTWNPYQAQRNFLFSRNLSYYATGTFRGVGYRDTAQDILAMVPFDLSAAKDKLRLLLSQQYQDGHVNHYFFPIEGYEPVTTVHSDDHLWTIMAVDAILRESNDLSFLKESVAYYDGQEASVLDHLRQAIQFTREHIGQHGFPLMLRSDWNDMLYRVAEQGKGESIWTAMQYGVVLQQMKTIVSLIGETDEAECYQELYDEQKQLVEHQAWDGEWYRRAIMDDGEYLGRHDASEAQIWLNSQSWAVISRMGSTVHSHQAMNAVYQRLNTSMGIKKIDPPIVAFPTKEAPLTNYNPGTGENGSIFCHANTWAIIAECLLGNAGRAYQYYTQLIPKHVQAKAGVWRYKAEPYVYASNIFGPDSNRFGLANVSWLTGTAAWMYIAVTQYMLGVRAEYGGLRIDPCLDKHFSDIEIKRLFRDCWYTIMLRQQKGQHGLVVDGQPVDGLVVPHEPGRRKCVVTCYY